MLDPRSGVGRFFRLLRDEGMDDLSYKILEVCMKDMNSANLLEEEFFKSGYNADFQDVLDYVVQFNHSLVEPSP